MLIRIWFVCFLALCTAADVVTCGSIVNKSEDIQNSTHSVIPQDDVVTKGSVSGVIGDPIPSFNLSMKRREIFSPWSPWTQCSKRCRQMRTRHCLVTAECGANMLTEERQCFRVRCRRDPSSPAREDKKQRRKKGHKNVKVESDQHVLHHLQSFIYSQWSNWSPCTKKCRTKRTRSCQIPDICGKNFIQEDALCYVEGSPCERLHKRRRRRKKSSLSGEHNQGVHPLSGIKCGIASKKHGLRHFLRIIGGREAVKGSWPWQVTILNKRREPFCGGTLLNDRWVLTAAHCHQRGGLFVRVGEHDFKIDEGTEQESRVQDSFLHPEYDSDTFNNDIALFLLRKPFDLNDHVHPICLPTVTDELPVQTMATILGWGKRRDSAVFGTDVLNQAEVPIVDIQVCRKVYNSYHHITDNMFCAGYRNGRVDSCAGDSGGPLLYKHGDRWVIHGITSFGEGCGQKGKFGIYAKVGKFVKWIQRTIARYS